MFINNSKNKNLKWHFLTFFFILTCTLLAYSNTFNSSWHFDDESNITENEYLQIDSFSFSKLNLLLRKAVNTRRFIANLSFAINYYFHEHDVFGYHLVNIIIHILAGITVYFFILLTLNRTFLKERYGKHACIIASCTAIIFAAHPVQTQSVTYIVQRMSSMAALFYLLSMVFYIKGRLSEGIRRILFLALSVTTAFLAFGTKENTIILPFMIFLYELFFFRKFSFFKTKKTLLFTLLLTALPLITLAIIFGPQHLMSILDGYARRDFTMAERLLTQPSVVLYYIGLLIFPLPSRLNLDYDFPISHSLFDPATTFISIIVISGLIIFSVIRAKRFPLVSYFILWYFLNLLIESSVIPLEIIYEHRLYLPSVGFFVLAVIFTIRFFEHIKIKTGINDLYSRWAGVCLSAIIISLLFIGTYQRNLIWKDEFTLLSDIIEKSPNKVRPHYNLGHIYKDWGRYNDAAREWKISLKLDPENSFAHSNLANIYSIENKYEKAGYHYRQAIKYEKNNSEALYNLANLLDQTGRPAEALIYYEKFIKSPSKKYETQKRMAGMRSQEIKAILNAYK